MLVMTSEYAIGAVKPTFGATPQRRLVLAAKVTTFCAVVAVVALVSCVLTFLICQGMLASKHAGLSITDPGVARAVAAGALHLVLVGAVAVGVGAVFRRTAGAVAVGGTPRGPGRHVRVHRLDARHHSLCPRTP